MDRRLRTRFDLTAPVTYSWKERPGVRRTGQGATRDVSERGLFVLSDSCPPVGTAIQFEVLFSFRDDSQIRMKAKGKVVRVQAEGNGDSIHGFAADTRVLWLSNQAVSAAGGTNVER